MYNNLPFLKMNTFKTFRSFQFYWFIICLLSLAFQTLWKPVISLLQVVELSLCSCARLGIFGCFPFYTASWTEKKGLIFFLF